MKISESVEHFYNYQRMNVKKNTLRNYEFILGKFSKTFQRHRANVDYIRGHFDIHVLKCKVVCF